MPAIASGGLVQTYGLNVGGSSLATQIAAGGSADTKGAAIQLAATTDNIVDTHWMLVSLTGAGTPLGHYLVDILAGVATETVIVPDLIFYPKGATGSFPWYLFPVYVPRDTRISARCQCSTASALARVSVTMIGGGPAQPGVPPPPGIVSAYGSTANSQGTLVDPGASSNTDSAWVEITPATDRDHHWLVFAGVFGDGAISATSWRMSVGIGAATESVLIPTLHFSADLTADMPLNPVVCLPCYIPKGSRLTVRARCSSTTAGDREVYVKLYGAG